MCRLPRGLRNRNPGNIRHSTTRYRGERESNDPAFKAFQSMAWGYRAMFVLLHTYRLRHGLTTLRGMIGRWAPPTENDTGHYLEAVAAEAKLDPDTAIDTLDRATMTAVVAAMSRVENGRKAVLTDVATGWRLFRTDF